jgi:hypothetical protein
VWVDLSLLCWEFFFSAAAARLRSCREREREINIKWQKRFYEELLPFYCFCNGGEFINSLARFPFTMNRMIHCRARLLVTGRFFHIIKQLLNGNAFIRRSAAEIDCAVSNYEM